MPARPDIEETGKTFADAYLKAMGIYRATGLPTVADDSGLCVDALNGAPGVYSARYAGEGHDSAANNAKLLREMEKIRMKGARHGLSVPFAQCLGMMTLCSARAPAKGPLPTDCTDRTALGMTRCSS